MTIDTEKISEHYRKLAVDLDNQRLLVTKFIGTEQEKDLSEPANCNGFGRIRHFHRFNEGNWIPNPLPIEPACKALNLEPVNLMRAQVFQNAVCNWRCWYCYVPFNLLSANKQYADLLSPKQLIEYYTEEQNPPKIIDLTGGQPDLVPEWVPWTMRAIIDRGLEQEIFLWSDDNLSNDYFWKFLTDDDLQLISSFKNYGRVCCFKGYNSQSFAFNTLADESLFERQFELMKMLLQTGIDLYCYATFTTPSTLKIEEEMKRFVDKLQNLDENLPLRTVPLQIEVFTPVKKRLDTNKDRSLHNQWSALECWQKELELRFSQEKRLQNIAQISLKNRKVDNEF